MSTIYNFDIEKAIKKLTDAGQKVSIDTHVIYASPKAQFTKDLYPLEIVLTDNMPEGTACIISARVKEIK